MLAFEAQCSFCETYAVPSLSVLGSDLVLVCEPVTVPPPEGSRVVYTNCVDHLDFKASGLESVDNESERSRSVSTWEDILVHEKTPGEVLELPGLTETGNLEEEGTVIVEHVVNLAEKATETTNTDVLSHLETGDLVEAALRDGNVAVVHAENSGLVFLDARLPEAVITPSSLVATKSDTSNVCTVVDRGEASKSAPTATNVEHPLVLLQVDLLADDGHLVVLELLEALLLVDIGNHTGSVDHAWTEEPAVEVVAAVVVVSDLFLVCAGISL